MKAMTGMAMHKLTANVPQLTLDDWVSTFSSVSYVVLFWRSTLLEARQWLLMELIIPLTLDLIRLLNLMTK